MALLQPRYFDDDQFLFEPLPYFPRRRLINVDMKETDTSFNVLVELPGINKSNIDVSIDNNILTISAEKREVKEENTTKSHLSEITFGSFKRTVTIPKNVDSDNITAKYADGILSISLPKQVKSNSKSLKIE